MLGRCKRLNVIGRAAPEKTAEKAVQLRTVRLHQGELVGVIMVSPPFFDRAGTILADRPAENS